MNIYHISQDDNDNYDTYDECVVYAENEEQAKCMHPCNEFAPFDKWPTEHGHDSGTWCISPDKVTVKFLGSTDMVVRPSFICKSFNAG